MLNNNILWRADCKDAMQQLIGEGTKVDLIYLDPPFNSSRVYNMIYRKDGVTAQQKAFNDMWSVTDQTRHMIANFEQTIDGLDASGIVKSFLKAWIAPLKEGTVKDKSTLLYLIYMAERLVLMKQLLKPTGSIYYHCDPTASHYIKIVMDGIFGRENFRNEIVWKRREERHNLAKKHMGRSHDIILFYTRSDKTRYDIVYQSYDDDYLRKGYKYEDERGCYATFPATNERGGNKVYEFKGISRAWRFSKERMEELDGLNMLTQASPTSPFRYKKYLDDAKGVAIDDCWNDIKPVRGEDYLGYPTQKPVALLDRIIKASCPEGGVVMDPFCGCGTTVEAAIKNGRSWIGVDISWDAVEVMKDRIKTRLFDYNQSYEFRDSNPQTKTEYDKLNAYQKQDWLIRKVKGVPNERKSGDGGVDGELTIHLGIDDAGNDKWGKMIFSVKSGKQASPELVRELIGSMKIHGADMGALILDKDPTQGMEDLAVSKGGVLDYCYNKSMPARKIEKVQIITSQEIFDGLGLDLPPTLTEVKLHRGSMGQMGLTLGGS